MANLVIQLVSFLFSYKMQQHDKVRMFDGNRKQQRGESVFMLCWRYQLFMSLRSLQFCFGIYFRVKWNLSLMLEWIHPGSYIPILTSKLPTSGEVKFSCSFLYLSSTSSSFSSFSSSPPSTTTTTTTTTTTNNNNNNNNYYYYYY